MAIDEDRIFAKIAYIQEQVLAIQSLLQEKTKEEIISDPWTMKGLKYALQTAVEAMVNIAYHISAKHFQKAPADSRDAINILITNQLLSGTESELYSAMVGFRNRVVHGYQTVSNDRIFEISSEELDIFSAYIKQINAFIKDISKS